MTEKIHLYDAVALLEAIPDAGLIRGHVGTVIEEWEPGVFEVEFSDQRTGITYAMLALRAEQLRLLHFKPESS